MSFWINKNKGIRSGREDDDFYKLQGGLTKKIKRTSLGSVGSGVVEQIQTKKEIDKNQ